MLNVDALGYINETIGVDLCVNEFLLNIFVLSVLDKQSTLLAALKVLLAVVDFAISARVN